MKREHFVICSGYGAESGNDILTVRLTLSLIHISADVIASVPSLLYVILLMMAMGANVGSIQPDMHSPSKIGRAHV